MAATFGPVLSFFKLDGTEIKNGVLDFGYVQPGGLSKPLSLELWNNRCTNTAAFHNPTTGAIDVTSVNAKSINVSFPDATNVYLLPVNADGSTDAKFNASAPLPTKDDAHPLTDWVAQVSVFDVDANSWGPFTNMGSTNIVSASLSGKHYDPYNDTLDYNKTKFVRMQVRIFVPYAATGNTTINCIIKAFYGTGATSPAGPGATNYADIV